MIYTVDTARNILTQRKLLESALRAMNGAADDLDLDETMAHTVDAIRAASFLSSYLATMLSAMQEMSHDDGVYSEYETTITLTNVVTATRRL